jgi:hypothetical protein
LENRKPEFVAMQSTKREAAKQNMVEEARKIEQQVKEKQLLASWKEGRNAYC